MGNYKKKLGDFKYMIASGEDIHAKISQLDLPSLSKFPFTRLICLLALLPRGGAPYQAPSLCR